MKKILLFILSIIVLDLKAQTNLPALIFPATIPSNWDTSIQNKEWKICKEVTVGKNNKVKTETTPNYQSYIFFTADSIIKNIIPVNGKKKTFRYSINYFQDKQTYYGRKVGIYRIYNITSEYLVIEAVEIPHGYYSYFNSKTGELLKYKEGKKRMKEEKKMTQDSQGPFGSPYINLGFRKPVRYILIYQLNK